MNDASVQVLPPHVTEETRELADEQVVQLLDEAYAKAHDLLEKNKGAYDAVVDSLVKQGTLSGKDLEKILKDHPPSAPTTKEPAEPVIA